MSIFSSKPNHALQEKFDHCYENVISYLYEYDSFMESVGRVAGLGCDKEAFDMQWWANATTRDEQKLQK